MAKRFIDTKMFDDPWFIDLSQDGKLFWVYCITRCDHAGIIEFSEKLFDAHTGINSLASVVKELGNRLVSVRDKYYFIPKYIEFQYPGFPNSKVVQQRSALEILKKLKIDHTKYSTVPEVLSNTYVNVNGNGNGNEESQTLDFEKMILAYPGDKFKTAWGNWIEYLKANHPNKLYKNSHTFEAAQRELKDMADDEADAIRLIDCAISKKWAGFYYVEASRKKQDAKMPDTWSKKYYDSLKDPELIMAYQRHLRKLGFVLQTSGTAGTVFVKGQ